MEAIDEFRAREVHTRFLSPFLFERGEAAAVAARLQRLEVPAKGGQLALWQPVHEPLGRVEERAAEQRTESLTALYTDELLCPVREFLFPRQGADGCRYLQADTRVVQPWFHNRVLVRHRDTVLFSALLDSPQFEVFLSPYGAGLLSIALGATARQWTGEADGIALEEVKHFNYRLAQTRRPGTTPTLSIPTRGTAPRPGPRPGTGWRPRRQRTRRWAHASGSPEGASPSASWRDSSSGH